MSHLPKLGSIFFFGLLSSPAVVFAADPVVVGKNVSANMDVLGVISSLLIVLGLIILSAYVLKRFNLTQASAKGMKVVSVLSLGTKEKLYVVDVNGEQLLLGVTSQQITLIEKLSEPLDVPVNSNIAVPNSVISMLKKKE